VRRDHWEINDWLVFLGGVNIMNRTGCPAGCPVHAREPQREPHPIPPTPPFNQLGATLNDVSMLGRRETPLLSGPLAILALTWG
jgi:hypothetical protein